MSACPNLMQTSRGDVRGQLLCKKDASGQSYHQEPQTPIQIPAITIRYAPTRISFLHRMQVTSNAVQVCNGNLQREKLLSTISACDAHALYPTQQSPSPRHKCPWNVSTPAPSCSLRSYSKIIHSSIFPESRRKSSELCSQPCSNKTLSAPSPFPS